ncbi:TetR family transcriptional regulator C-terminal domain-containing protein [Paeniglutamicibacter antarcticus]|uniref:TetR family transcriptional regulator C-terminal domain-containing protein n=1 Tax=Paeniglutamicibacter antarcticus TaxID=494023 RepID=A0ABP9TQB9_9MICC
MQSSETGRAGLPGRARAAIRDSGLAQREVSRRIGVEESKLSKSLKGFRKITADEIVLLAMVTGVTANWLITGSDSAPGASTVPPQGILPQRHRGDDKHAQRRRAIIERAWWLFAERGFEAVRIADIAAEVGISTPTVHYYFENKQAIFAETLHFSVKLAYDRQIAELAQIIDPAQRLIRLIELQLPTGPEGRAEWSIWLQTWTKLAVNDGGLDSHSPGYGRWVSTVRDVIASGQQEGCFVDEDPGILTAELTSLIDGMGIKVLAGLLTSEQMFTNIRGFINRTIITTKDKHHES